MDDEAGLSSIFRTPTIEQGVSGPKGESGILLRAPISEELHWDLEMEVATARRYWSADRDGWWVAASYLQTVVGIVLRSFPSVLVLGPHEDRLLSRDGSDIVQGRLL
jgi:hypothetical protein